jgi:intein-encoded DNA endonuclease-like protein
MRSLRYLAETLMRNLPRHMRPKLSLEEEQSVISFYRQGYSAAKIGPLYGICSQTVCCILERHGIQRRSASQHALSPEQEQEIVGLYQQGNSSEKIASHYGLNGQTVLNILERQHINRRERNSLPRLYSLNTHAFDAIDTEEAAYWLGFIAADGSIKSEGVLRIGLAECDKGHLLKCTAWISPDRPIYEMVNNHGKPTVHIEIGSTHLCNVLATYGITPRKTYTLKHLPGLAPDMMRHFLRGYFDGDGYINTTRYMIGIGSFNKEFVEEIQDFLIQETGVKPVVLIHSGTWRYNKSGKREIIKILSFLYNNARVYLDRKYELAQNILKSGM